MLILNYSWASWLAWLLGAFFIVNGVLNIAGFRPFREAFDRWGFPPWFRFFNGVVDIAAGLMIVWYPTRPFGLLLSLLICLAIWIVLVKLRAYDHLPPSILLAAMTLLTAWGLRLI